jgi:hypothetical protein
MGKQDDKGRPPGWRFAYTEEDVQALISEPRFLVAADAYGAGCCTLQQMTKLAFTAPPYLPRNLQIPGFAALVIDVVKRIHAGKLEVREEWKRQYADFYRKQPKPPVD